MDCSSTPAFANSYQRVGENATARIDFAILAGEHDLPPSELATGFEPSNHAVAKQVMSNRVKNRASELRYLNTKFKQQLPFAATKKPFDVVAEGLISKNSRGDGI